MGGREKRIGDLKYEVILDKKVQKVFQKIPEKDRLKISKRITELQINPRPKDMKSLSGDLENLERVRVGNYRIIYQILDHVLKILVVKIGHRKDIYD